MRGGLVHARLAAAAVVLLLVGCSSAPTGQMPVPAGAGTSPTPTPTQTALPGAHTSDRPDEIDPRCLVSYTDHDFDFVLNERDLLVRPEFWPFAPDWAVLCWAEGSATEEIAYYATDVGIARAEVFRYYEDKFAGRGTHWRMTGDYGEILTGVYPPNHSYFIEHDYEMHTYVIDWAIDGDYADD